MAEREHRPGAVVPDVGDDLIEDRADAGGGDARQRGVGTEAPSPRRRCAVDAPVIHREPGCRWLDGTKG